VARCEQQPVRCYCCEHAKHEGQQCKAPMPTDGGHENLCGCSWWGDREDNYAPKFIAEFCKKNKINPSSLMLTRLRTRGFSTVQLMYILDILEASCPNCYDGDLSCKCLDPDAM